ncbi:unnamed protein product [Closterium sp. Naga37s-1]|nr:unnamed protein product [Closterium sp. Naga37s-1]
MFPKTKETDQRTDPLGLPHTLSPNRPTPSGVQCGGGGSTAERHAVAFFSATSPLSIFLISHLPPFSSSTFADIFDAPFFIAHLAPFLPIVPTLPPNSFHVPPNYFPPPPLAVRLRRLTRLSLHVAAGLATGRRPLMPPYVLLPPKISPPQWASADYYVAHVGPALRDIGAVRLNPFANRLSSRGLPLSLQRLRCRCNFHLLRFLTPIRTAALTALHRLSAHAAAATATAARSARSSNGPPVSSLPAALLPTPTHVPPAPLLPWIRPPARRRAQAVYVAVHVRFEKDMLAFSRCSFSSSPALHRDLQRYRTFAWSRFHHSPAAAAWEWLKAALGWGGQAAAGQGSKVGSIVGRNMKGSSGSGEEGAEGESARSLREAGHCPLSPLEVLSRAAMATRLYLIAVALFMRAAGISPAVPVFVASGELYGPQRLMNAFTALFPRTLTKAHLLSPAQLRPFQVSFPKASHERSTSLSHSLLHSSTSPSPTQPLYTLLTCNTPNFHLRAIQFSCCEDHASQLAAIDYLIVLHAPLVVLSHGSNFGHVVTGQRRYLHAGHAGVLKPDKRRLAQLFTHTHLRWASFRASVHALVRAGREAEHKVEAGGQVGAEGGDERMAARERVGNVTVLEVARWGVGEGGQQLRMDEGRHQKQDTSEWRKGRTGKEKENEMSPYVIPQSFEIFASLV